MEYILGIDIGTGSTKAVAVDMNHHAVDSSQHFYPTMTPQPGYSEQDPELIWQAFQQCIEELVSKFKCNPSAISLSSAMHSLIAVDQEGRAMAPMMTWADSRSGDVADRLLSEPAGLELYRETGTPVHSMSPLCKVIWFRENHPEFFKRVYKFISIKEYIWHRIFQVFEIDQSIASCTGFLHTGQLSWSEKALHAAGISAGQLSSLVPTGYIRKDFHQQHYLSFLENGTPFVIGASDGCLANLGSGAIAPGTAALTIGTSGALRVASEKAVVNEEAMTFNYHLDERIFINGGAVNNGGVALKWHLRNMFQKMDLDSHDYDQALAAAKDLEPGSEGLVFLPYLQGERAPIWDSKSCGNFFGIRLTHQPHHFTRSLLEGICFALNDVLESLDASGQPVDVLNVSGGFVSSPVWLQLMADITGKKLMVTTAADASAMGAAFLAMKALLIKPDYPVPDGKDRVIIEPDQDNHQKYKIYFSLYKKLYQQLKGLMHELYDLQN